MLLGDSVKNAKDCYAAVNTSIEVVEPQTSSPMPYCRVAASRAAWNLRIMKLSSAAMSFCAEWPWQSIAVATERMTFHLPQMTDVVGGLGGAVVTVNTLKVSPQKLPNPAFWLAWPGWEAYRRLVGSTRLVTILAGVRSDQQFEAVKRVLEA